MSDAHDFMADGDWRRKKLRRQEIHLLNRQGASAPRVFNKNQKPSAF
jgi:hypothetical protein